MPLPGAQLLLALGLLHQPGPQSKDGEDQRCRQAGRPRQTLSATAWERSSTTRPFWLRQGAHFGEGDNVGDVQIHHVAYRDAAVRIEVMHSYNNPQVLGTKHIACLFPMHTTHPAGVPDLCSHSETPAGGDSILMDTFFQDPKSRGKNESGKPHSLVKLQFMRDAGHFPISLSKAALMTMANLKSDRNANPAHAQEAEVGYVKSALRPP